MGYVQSVITEAVVVGLMLALALTMAVRVVPIGNVAVLGFVVGAGVHLIFEATKANQWYCTYGAACAARPS